MEGSCVTALVIIYKSIKIILKNVEEREARSRKVCNRHQWISDGHSLEPPGVGNDEAKCVQRALGSQGQPGLVAAGSGSLLGGSSRNLNLGFQQLQLAPEQ